MKKILVSIAAVTAISGAPGARASDAIYGVWVREGHPTDKLEFYDCAGKLCAKGVLPMLDGRPAPQILRSAAKTGANSWKGDLFNPEDGKTYTGKITYDSPNQLTLTGCLVAFLCQSETWTRVSGPTKAAAPTDDSKSDAKPHDAAKDAKPHDAAKDAKPHEAGKDAKPHDGSGKDAKAHDAAGKGAEAAKSADKAAAKPKAPKPAPKPEAGEAQ
ncbi:MAG: hypothetical protein CTY15_10645 [Methylocystis sp.]|nr:MAG: hypothetical protein CTY15_10645 [Methylocystis sp.]